MPDTALILFSHGSLLCGASSSLRNHAHTIRQSGQFPIVEVAFLNYCQPDLDTAISACKQAGAKSVIVVPYFLVAGRFVNEDLPARIAEYQVRDTIPIHVARALEDSPAMFEAIQDVTSTVHKLEEWQSSAFAEMKKVCELRPNCPLYGTPACQVKPEQL